jgi:hypothetical protein
MICPKCETEVKTNGIGPSNSPKFSATLKFIYGFSCKLFKEAGQKHDFSYHIYQYSKQQADEEFLENMIQAIDDNDCNWFSKKWYHYQANKFYLAVKLGGEDSYLESQEVCLKQMNLNSRDY